jgi:hypothetical protein
VSPTLAQYNPTIRTPDGRIFRGRHPHSLGDQGEAPYIAKLAQATGGICEVTLPAGRADVATDTHVYEVEPVKSWRKGAQQAFAYAGMTGLEPVLALFGAADYFPIYQRIRDRMRGLTLWVWRDWGKWEPVTSNHAARLIVKGPAHPNAWAQERDNVRRVLAGIDPDVLDEARRRVTGGGPNAA